MKTSLRMLVVATVALAISCLLDGVPVVRGQSGTRRQAPAGRASAPFEVRFWNWLQQVEYRNWAPWPGQNGAVYAGKSPHGAFLKMYVERKAASNPKDPPHGSVIVKENYGPDKKTLMAITVMYRAEDYDRDHNDWYWVKYNPDGSVAMKGAKRLAGRVAGCIDCHGSAGGEDFLFANDG